MPSSTWLDVATALKRADAGRGRSSSRSTRLLRTSSHRSRPGLAADPYPRPIGAEVQPQTVRTHLSNPVVGSWQCEHCRIELRPERRGRYCSARCRAAGHRHQQEEARRKRDEEIRGLLELALSRLQEDMA